MAENDPKPASDTPPQRPATRSAAKSAAADEPVNPDEREYNENYVGIDPIYANSAYEEPLNPEEADVPDDASDEEKEAAEAAFEAEQEMTEKVKENEEANKVVVEEPVPFEEWVGETDAANRKSTISGVDQERAEADQQKTEDAKGDRGTIPPRSTSTHQPGVNRIT